MKNTVSVYKSVVVTSHMLRVLHTQPLGAFLPGTHAFIGLDNFDGRAVNYIKLLSGITQKSSIQSGV